MKEKQAPFRVALMLLAVAAGCGKSKQAAPATQQVADAGQAAAAAPAETATWADHPEPALRALEAALEAFDTTDANEWLERRELPRPAEVPPEEPPAAVQAAIDALVAWDGSGALAPIPCSTGFGDVRPHRLLLLARCALRVSSSAADPPAHAALRLGVALRSDDNDPLAMMVGAAIAQDAAKSFTVPTPFVLAQDLPWRVVASNARCVSYTLDRLVPGSKDAAELEQTLAQLGWSGPETIAREKEAVRAFWATTMEQVAQARSRTELRRVLEQRVDEAQKSRSRSLLLPLLGPPFAAKSLLADDR